MSTDIDPACEQLVKALRDHAAVLSQSDASSATVASAIQEVRSAARSYTDAIFDSTGWGNVFADIYKDEDEDDDESEETFTAPEAALRVSLEARWDFVVENPDALMRYVCQRLIENDWDEQQAVDHTDSPEGAMNTLFDLDGWDVDDYAEQGVERAGNGWSVYRIEKTLYEMDHAERSETGF
ncbi:hypothetical protein [Planomonospora sp. ID82291]|uniref:hypothetical protein n=1 Tax=Planomonospora sp. ID82291 TaxID=2738136 RepID=UPI0018C3E912|nr:hypothetical protein [Planomonospora sp. ID82291]MBG0814341.1 hypothetical protein [Planomonospora sp. ID82291]